MKGLDAGCQVETAAGLPGVEMEYLQGWGMLRENASRDKGCGCRMPKDIASRNEGS